MYLSLLRLNREQSKSLKFTDTYSLHRIVYSCFTKEREDSQSSSGFLFTELSGTALEKRVLILSRQSPDAPFNCNIQIKKIPTNFFGHSHYRFEVIMNPVKRNSQSRKLIPLRTSDDIKKWFCEKSTRWGFQCSDAHVEVKEIFVDRFTKGSHQVTMGKARISGILQVCDQELFINSLSAGLGKGKAFGCGLLQLTPIQ